CAHASYMTTHTFFCVRFFFFFFSSRRRHTRFSRDWSSDVCSSDLSTVLTTVVGLAIFLAYSTTAAVARSFGAGRMREAISRGVRSEERRVGKECRSRGSPEHYKKKQRSGHRRR